MSLTNSNNKMYGTDRRLTDLRNALYVTPDDLIAVRTGIEGDIVINGDVNIPGTVTVNSSPEDPVHTHITEVGTSGILTTNYLPIGGTVNIGTEVSVFTDSGNTLAIEGTVYQGNPPWQISKNTDANSSTNPIYVTGSGGTMGDFPDVAVTAFEEPLAVGITPLQQLEAVYGLDPLNWKKSELRGGTITTANSTWLVQSGTSAGGYARLATSRYTTYPPGQGLMFRWTAAFTTNGTTKDSFGVDNIVQNTGPIDREDGYSIGYSGATDDDTHRKIGILHRRGGKAEIRKLTITTYPTGTQTATITIDSVVYTITLTASTSTAYTTHQIAALLQANTTLKNTWDIDACDSELTFSYYSPGSRAGTYSFSSSGTGTLAVASWSQVVAGSAPTDTWHYIGSWNGTVPAAFNPNNLNVFGMDMRWLGAGRVRFFMEDPATGKFVTIHTLVYASTQVVPHVSKPSLRIVYRSGTTNPAITPGQNVIVRGASVFGGVQGLINQTGESQGYYTIQSAGLAKDLIHHVLSIQNPFVRNNSINKSSLVIQDLTVSQQGQDPSVIFIIKNAVGTSDYIVFSPIPGASAFYFAQYSNSAVTENLALDTLANIQTLGINSSSTFNLKDYNLELAPGEYLSVFITSSNAINKVSCGMTWRVD